MPDRGRGYANLIHQKKEGSVNPTPRLPANVPDTGSPSFEIRIAVLLEIVNLSLYAVFLQSINLSAILLLAKECYGVTSTFKDD